MNALLFALGSVSLSTAGQLLLASGSKRGVAASLVSLLWTPAIVAGLSCWIASTLLWIAALQRERLGVVYALTSLNYVLVPLGARFLLGERFSAPRAFGMGLIAVGVLLTMGGRE
jgi:drug/metabolite transporter (DMT)-like permease